MNKPKTLTPPLVVGLDRKVRRYWLREYRCITKECCDGKLKIQVFHSEDVKSHRCTWCDQLCEFVRDVYVHDVPNI